MDDNQPSSNTDSLNSNQKPEEKEIKIPDAPAQEEKGDFKDIPFKKEEQEESKPAPLPWEPTPDPLSQALLAQKKEDDLLEEGEGGEVIPLIRPEEQLQADPGPVLVKPQPGLGSGQEEAPVIPLFVPPESPPPPVAPQEPAKKSSLSFLPKPVLIGLGALLLFLLILGISKLFSKKESAPAGEPVTLTYWGLWEPEPVMGGVIAQFEKDHPNIKISYKMQSPKEYKARLQNALNSGQGPDIFRIHATWLPLLSKELEEVPSAVAQKLGLESNYFPVVTKAISFNKRFYALPLEVDTLALFYNKDLLKEVGGQLPRTWWGLQKLAKEITKTTESGKITIAGVALGTTNNVDHFSDIIGLMLLQNEADPGKPDQLVKDVLQYYTLFSSKDKVWDKTLPNSTTQFASGKLGFYFAPSWRYFEIKAQNPGLNFGIAKVPQLPESREIDFEAAEAGEGELTNIAWASFWVEGVASSSKNKAAAWEFLGYLASAEGLRHFYQAASQVRDFGEIYPLTNLAGELTTNPYLEPFVKQAENADFWYLSSDTHDASLNDLMIKYYEDALNSFAKSGPNNEALETLQLGVGQLVEQYQL